MPSFEDYQKFWYFALRLEDVSTNMEQETPYIGLIRAQHMTTESLTSFLDRDNNPLLNEHHITYLIRLLRFLYRDDPDFQYTDAELRNNPIKSFFGINTDDDRQIDDDNEEFYVSTGHEPQYDRQGGKKNKRKTKSKKNKTQRKKRKFRKSRR
jgi:hypothetical protein